MNYPFLLFDIGGTKTRLGITKDGNKIEEYRIIPTPTNFNEGMKQIHEVSLQLLQGAQIGAVAGGIAGSLTVDKSSIFRAPHLKDWSDKPIKEHLAHLFRCPVFLENDTAMVGLGEAIYGSGKGFRIVCYITVSTGVNGVKIVDGAIDPSALGYEIGHQVINFTASSHSAEYGKGELEDYVSGSAIERRFHTSPLELTDAKVWEDTAKFLSYGLYNTILHWSPEMVVLGGSLMKRISLERVRAHLKEILTIFPQTPLIDTAALGELGGVYGSLAYIKRISRY